MKKNPPPKPKPISRCRIVSDKYGSFNNDDEYKNFIKLPWYKKIKKMW